MTDYFYSHVEGGKAPQPVSVIGCNPNKTFFRPPPKPSFYISVMLVATSFLLQGNMLLKCFINKNCSQINCIERLHLENVES